ncbi:MAG TPA: hypothetical protein VMV18_04060 [bacterium]|nr:hypothetical protein [bacterium]
MFRRFRHSDAGQTATEYMMMISVVVVAIVAAAYIFVPSFQDGVSALAEDTSSILDNGTVGGTGTDRDGSNGGTNGGTRGMRAVKPPQ